MIAREQNLGNLPVSKLGWTRVLRRFEQPVAETIVGSGMFVTQNSRQESRDRVNKNGGGNRAVCEHVVANRNLRVNKVICDTMIDPFVVPANHDQMFTF